MNICGQVETDPKQKPERSWWWIGPAITVVGFLIFFWAIMYLSGCAHFKYQDAIGTIEYTTIGKDIVVDPNTGFMSTVSPRNQGIIEAIGGFIIGLFVG